MNRLVAIGAVGLAACNVDVGECWLRGEGTDGAGGSIIFPSAATGDWHQNGDDVGSDASEQMAGCTPINKCALMYEECVAKGYPCTRLVEGGKNHVCRLSGQLLERWTVQV